MFIQKYFFTPQADIDLILTHVSQIVFHHKLDSSVKKKITFYKRNTINYQKQNELSNLIALRLKIFRLCNNDLFIRYSKHLSINFN